jgi:hypothetical protein
MARELLFLYSFDRLLIDYNFFENLNSEVWLA